MDPKKLGNSAHKEIHWEDYQQELARLISLSSAIQQANQNKLSLQKKLDSFVKIEADSLSRKNELEEISQRVEDKKLVLGNVLMQAKVVEEHVKTKQEYLSGEIRSLLVSGKSLTISRKRLQESSRLFAGERGYTRLNTLEKMLRARQQHMISHVSFIYPVKTLIGATQELELDSFPNCSSSGSSSASVDEYRKKNRGNLSISGVQLSMIPFTQMTLFTDKNQMQKSTTALGYVAHVCPFSSYTLLYEIALGARGEL